MSLLDRTNETVSIYPEEHYTDSDGNLMTRPSKTGIVQDVRIFPAAQSGTSSRRSEQDNEGFESEEVYKLRLPRSWTGGDLGLQSYVYWDGSYWAVIGYPIRHRFSRRTRHQLYTIRRS
ncbi:Hypothetical protein AJAP_28120 [Amycolatopsis japonica]|uniref:Head-to-tail stopper n=1 Tax=Amycolatopsis japonica TaxID=208439 RepID=A0A075UWA6_9PSEU|nr:hypothetical protein [Amycolatopsis japonica]AIG78462.1 Hypothetical protein AJAP_28120 [Amycolatopsis japonica]